VAELALITNVYVPKGWQNLIMRLIWWFLSILNTLKLAMKKVSVVILQHQSCQPQFPHFWPLVGGYYYRQVLFLFRMTSITTRVLLDSASQRTFMTKNLAKQLNLKSEHQELLSVSTFAAYKFSDLNTYVVQFHVELKDGTNLAMFANPNRKWYSENSIVTEGHSVLKDSAQGEVSRFYTLYIGDDTH